MNTTDFPAFIAELGVELPERERFWKLAKLTALRQRDDGSFFEANFERGALVYALVARFRPESFLEFGTGRGYGSLCAAWAMHDHEVAGRVHTIDFVPPDEPQQWAIDRGDGPQVSSLSRADVWPEAAPPEWLAKVNEITGRTGTVMKRWSEGPVDMAFIDAGHDLRSVAHDYYSVLEAGSDGTAILFDDYAPTPGFGVQQLVDDEVAGLFATTLVYTDGRWPPPGKDAGEPPPYGMVWATPRPDLSVADGREARLKALKKYRAKEPLVSAKRKIKRLVLGDR